MASDYFRCHRLAAEGGLYVDAAFLPGPLAPQLLHPEHPVFAPSAPAKDLTPQIRQARSLLGRVLLNGILHAGPATGRYFPLLAILVRRLVRQRAAEQIPMVTGIGVLTVFDYIASLPEPDPAQVMPILRKAMPPDSDRVLDVIRAFLADHGAELAPLAPCTSLSISEMETSFFRPAEDQTRLSDPAHWTNHRGSIFAPDAPLSPEFLRGQQ